MCLTARRVALLSATGGSFPSSARGEPQGIMSEDRPIPSPRERSLEAKLPPGYLAGGIAGQVDRSFGR
jgi:hypothetical protein